MKRRVWTPEQKLQIVLEGLRGQGSVAELCNRHEICQAQYYGWRDRLLSEGAKLFAHGGLDRHAEQLQRQVQHLKAIIGDLTVELKKNDW